MRSIIFIGSIGAGKTTLSQALLGEGTDYEKTQQVTIRGNAIVDTPGEYLDNFKQRGALMTSAAEAEVIGFVQSAKDVKCMFPPGYAGSFAKEVIGFVTKTDAATEEEIRTAEKKLRLAGVDESRIFYVSGKEKSGLEPVKEYLDDSRKVERRRSNNW